MRPKTTRVKCNSQVQTEDRPALILTDAALLEIASDDAPVLTLTPAALRAIEDEAKQATADVLMHELKRYPGLQLVLAECFKQAYQAHEAWDAATGLNNVQKTSAAFSQACEGLFFQLKGVYDLAVKD